MRRLRLHVLRRRQYSVPGPNSLWHIDGNHKLIRYQIVADNPYTFLEMSYKCIYLIDYVVLFVLKLPCRWRFVVHGGVDGFSR